MPAYWLALPLQDESIRVAKLRNPQYEDALRKNVSKKYFDRLKLIARTKSNYIQSTFAPPGYGKSYSVLFVVEQYAKYTGKTLKIDNVFFHSSDMLKAIGKEDMDKNEIFILDEQVRTRGHGSRAEIEDLQNIEMTVRQHKLSFFFLAPEFVRHTFHYYTETWQMGSDKPIDLNKDYEKQWKYTKSILYDHRDAMLGYIVTGKPSNIEFLEAYEQKKNLFIEKVRRRKTYGRYAYVKEKSAELALKPGFAKEFQLAKTMTVKKVVVILALEGEAMTTAEINMLVQYLQYVQFKERSSDNIIEELESKIETKKSAKKKKSLKW